jgi:hypothetical protein
MTDLHCSCGDCESAVSPGAYLASLLDYALKHVQNGDTPLDLGYFTTRFHQPFAGLPLDCEAADATVPQVRIAVEVLRSYVGLRPLLRAGQENRLVAGEADYRLAAYTALLAGAGTSYEEVRRVRNGSTEERLALAERLAVPEVSLDQLYRDASLPDELTEEFLEQTFGLAGTTAPPLLAGLKTGDAAGQLTSWRFTGADPGRSTDADGVIYLSIAQDGPRYTVSAYADAARTTLAASGGRATPNGPVRLTPREGSGLVGSVELAYTADAAGISVAVAPLLQCWRLGRLRGGWLAQDWPTPAVEGVPLVDPQTIGIADLRSTRPGNAAYDLWLARYNDLATRRAALVAAKDTAADAASGLTEVIALALSRPGDPVDVSRLGALDDAQRLGERIGPRLAPLGLTSAAFAFLIPIVRLAMAGQPILVPEWDAVIDTLLVASKRRDFAEWRAAEQAAGITLSPDYFRLATDDSAAPLTAVSLTIAPWLSTRDARRAWSEVLEARIGQEAAVGAGVNASRNSAEESTLPLLRDLLVEVSDAEGQSLAEKADWLTRRLLLDLRTAGTHRTTRVAQAIETLQELLFRLRTGQLPLDDPGKLSPRSSVRAVATPDGRTHLLALDDDGTVWHRVWDGIWRTWHSIGVLPGAGFLTPSALAIALRGEGFDIAVVGGDRTLWVRRYESGWEPWQQVPGGPQLTGGPALTARGPNTLDAYVLRIGDLQVLRLSWDGITWSAPEDVGVTSQRVPAAASLTPDTVDLVVARSGADLFKPLHRWWDGATWQSENLAGILGSDAVLVNADRLELYQNLSGRLHRLVRDGGVWLPWEDVDAGLAATDPQLEAAPTVTSPEPAVVDVYGVRRGRFGPALWFRQFAAGVWSAWSELPTERLELDAMQFDAEWQWIGSYATWRSAVFVRLYPDNLLLPSLAPRQTPAFAELVAQTRPTRRVTPAQADALALDYAGYLADVSALKVQASCRVAVRVMGPSGVPILRAVEFLFGWSPAGRVYWCTFDQAEVDAGGYAQGFWTEVPLAAKETDSAAPRVSSIVGALPWLNPSLDQHYISLFLIASEAGDHTLVRARFDLDRFGRDDFCEAGAVAVGGLPPGAGGVVESVDRMTLVPVQSDRVDEAPRLAIHTASNGKAYLRALNASTDGFVQVAGDWAACEVIPKLMTTGGFLGSETVTGLYGALRTGGNNWLVYAHNASVRLYPQRTGGLASSVVELPDQVVGVLPGGPSTVLVFTEQGGTSMYQAFSYSAGTTQPGTLYLSPGVPSLARHTGATTASFLVAPGDAGHWYAYLCRLQGDQLISSRKFDVVPVLGSVTSIPSKQTVFELQNRRAAVRGVYDNNAAASESLLCVLREAYRLVPQQLALALQGTGEYVAALDWFATVYDYRAPLPDRYIDHGLALDATLPATSVLRQPEGWLLDPLNPHAVARTRRAATARYAIAAIIGCLNAYADSEFGTDTSESLVRARLLYDTALGLCDVPELRQALPDCGALIGALQISPGESVPPDIAAALGAIAEELSQGAAFPAPGSVFTQEKYLKLIQQAKAGMVEWATVVPELLSYKEEVLASAAPPPTAGGVVLESAARRATAYTALLADPAVEKAVRLAGALGAAIPVSLGAL